MGLIKTKEEREEKMRLKEEKLLQKYGMEDLEGKDAESVKTIASEMAGMNIMETGAKLSLGMNKEDTLKVSYLRAIYEQNWIIIRQLDKLNKK